MDQRLENERQCFALQRQSGRFDRSNFYFEMPWRAFFPQFCMKDKQSLHIWVIGHGNQTEVNSFEVTVKFWINGKTTFAHDFIKSIDIEIFMMYLVGQDCLAFQLKEKETFLSRRTRASRSPSCLELMLSKYL